MLVLDLNGYVICVSALMDLPKIRWSSNGKTGNISQISAKHSLSQRYLIPELSHSLTIYPLVLCHIKLSIASCKEANTKSILPG